MSTSQHHPKFVMQVNRQQPVPKLVSINDFVGQSPNIPTGKKDRLSRTGMREKSADKPNKKSTINFYDSRQDQSLAQDNRSQTFYTTQSQVNYGTNGFTSSNGQNTSIPQNQSNPPPSSYYTTFRKQLPVTQARNYRLEVIQLQKLLEIERQEKLQLQQIIKQLTVQSEKLKQVNQHIVDRLKQLQKNFVQQKMHQQKEQDERVRKVINQVYQDVQTYVRSQIQTLTNKLKGQKMTPLLQKKLQLFMESMLQINQNTVQMSKISKKRHSFVGSALSPFISDRTVEKENLSVSNVNFNNRINLLFDSKSKNESFMSRSSHKYRQSSPQSGRRLINNAYITSKKSPSPSKVLFQTSKNNQSFPHQYSTILKQLQNNHQSFRQEHTRQSPQEIPLQHVQFANPFNTNSSQVNNRNRRSDRMNESYIERKKYYETSNYEDNKFHVKEYTPNKRKRIFDDRPSRSKSKRYDTVHQ